LEIGRKSLKNKDVIVTKPRTVFLKMKMRNVIAVLILVLAVGAFAFYLCYRYPKGPIPAFEFKENLKDALKMKQEQSRSAFQLAVVLLGALWTTLLAKKDEITFQLSDWPPTAMFMAGNVLLLTSIYFHLKYLEFTSNEVWNTGIGKTNFFPDIVSTHLNNAYFGQNTMLGAGLLCTAFHLLVVYKFKPPESEIDPLL
jgi:hypothetical protein